MYQYPAVLLSRTTWSVSCERLESSDEQLMELENKLLVWRLLEEVFNNYRSIIIIHEPLAGVCVSACVCCDEDSAENRSKLQYSNIIDLSLSDSPSTCCSSAAVTVILLSVYANINTTSDTQYTYPQIEDILDESC